MRIVFFGTPHFAHTVLSYLFHQCVDIAAIVTRPDKPRGRSQKPAFSPVKEFALAHNLPLFQPSRASDQEFALFLKTLKADFFVVAAYAEILKENILEIPRLGAINVHGSLLPKYRGAAPVQRSIMAGESESGVTIMKMALQLDAGDILAMHKISIPLSMTSGELMSALAELGKIALWDVLKGLEYHSITPIQQRGSEASYAKKITPQEAEIQWNLPALATHNRVRAVTPNPGAWCWIELRGEKKRLLIKKTWPLLHVPGDSGQIVSTLKHDFIVGCQEGSIQLLEVQLEGKKAMQAEEFLRGFPRDKIKFLT